MIVSPNSFVQGRHAVSASEVQVSAALNQDPDALHRQARLHGHSEGGFWPIEKVRMKVHPRMLLILLNITGKE